jgi:hypothetical protein
MATAQRADRRRKVVFIVDVARSQNCTRNWGFVFVKVERYP